MNKKKYLQVLTTRSEVLQTAREATKEYLNKEGLYDKCKYLFIAGDSSYIDDPYPRQQCGSEEFLEVIKEISPCLSYEIMSSHSDNYIVSFMHQGTEFFAVLNIKELRKEGLTPNVSC